MLNLSQINFCAAECERQQSGEMSVYNMCDALHQILEWSNVMSPVYFETLDNEIIQNLGRLIEPNKNEYGYRKTPVQIGNEVLSNADLIPRQMSNLIDWLNGTNFDRDIETTIRDFYYSFEKIHPFIDGNGRVGAILYNYLKGSLENPVAPPNVFGAKEQEGS